MLVPYRDKNNLDWSREKNLGSSLPFATVVWQINLMPNWRLHLQNIKGGERAIPFERHSPQYDGCFLTVLTHWQDNTPPLPVRGTWHQPDIGNLRQPPAALPSPVWLLPCPHAMWKGAAEQPPLDLLPSLPLSLTLSRHMSQSSLSAQKALHGIGLRGNLTKILISRC